jgi:hypothetical protein
MNLVEAEEVGPVEGDAPLVTPPRPPHRRVSVSLLFTLTVLVGTVVAIYAAFPNRHNVLLTEAIDRHREPPTWQLQQPTPGEVRAWVLGFAGKEPPLPPTGKVVGASKIVVHDRDAALMRIALGEDEVTYLCQRARGISPKYSDRTDGDLTAYAWRKGPFTCVAVGPTATTTRWHTQF